MSRTETSKHVRQREIFNIMRLRTTYESALNVKEIKSKLENADIFVDEKTIRRDLEDIHLGFKVIKSGDYPERYYIKEGTKFDYHMTFSTGEMHIIIMALQGLKTKASPGMKERCAKTEALLLGKLNNDEAKDFEKLRAYTMVTPAFRGESALEDPETFIRVMKSLKEEKVIECENHSPYTDEIHNHSKRKFTVLYLNLVGGENYLWVHDHHDNQAKQVKLCRIHNVHLLDEKADPKLREKLKDLENCIGGFGGPNQPVIEYTIECDKVMAALFKERKIHHTQEVIKKGHRYLIKFRCNPSIEINRYISGWAKNIYSLQPESFRNDVEEIWAAGSNRKAEKKAA